MICKLQIFCRSQLHIWLLGIENVRSAHLVDLFTPRSLLVHHHVFEELVTRSLPHGVELVSAHEFDGLLRLCQDLTLFTVLADTLALHVEQWAL